MRGWRAVAIGGSMLLAWSCKDTITGNSPSTVVFPANNVSYNAEVQVLFNQACNYSGCHDEGTHQSPLKLTSWGETVTVGGVVIPGKPDQSILVFWIEGRVGTERMPPGSQALNQNQINGIRTWVAEGAKNN
jgi:mono/diheme cytochrome c family protein